MMTRNALEGVRVLDFTSIWAGPAAARMLGDLGADVIKVESARRMDPTRGGTDGRGGGTYPDGDPGAEPWNRSAQFNDRNRSKRGVCLDLTHPRGVEVCRRLVAASDVVVESFRQGVMEAFGLDYPALREVNPRVVMVSLSSQGATGPERAYVSFGATLEQTGGLAAITGYVGGDPTTSGTFFPDPVVSVLAVGVILAALRRRDRTGAGTYIDLSQRETATSITGEAVMDFTMHGRKWQPMGNRHPVYAPQGVYRCAGDDAWVALTVRTDDEWRSLADAIGQPELADDARFATREARRAQHDEIDALISAWTCDRTPVDVADALAARGIPAGRVATGREVLEDPQLTARRFWETDDHPAAGRHAHLGRPFRLSETPAFTRRPAPLLGEHTEEVLREIAGLSDAEIRELAALGVTERDPRRFD